MTHQHAIDPINEQIGKQLELARKNAGMTLQQLATLIGVSYQQFQKYEKGVNRISAEKLWKLSQLLKIPITDFFIDPRVLKATQQLMQMDDDIQQAFIQFIESRSNNCF